MRLGAGGGWRAMSARRGRRQRWAAAIAPPHRYLECLRAMAGAGARVDPSCAPHQPRPATRRAAGSRARRPLTRPPPAIGGEVDGGAPGRRAAASRARTARGPRDAGSRRNRGRPRTRGDVWSGVGDPGARVLAAERGGSERGGGGGAPRLSPLYSLRLLHLLSPPYPSSTSRPARTHPDMPPLSTATSATPRAASSYAAVSDRDWVPALLVSVSSSTPPMLQ